MPELLITHFDIINHEVEKDILHLHFEEKADIPEGFSSRIVISHGFHKAITIQDFPIRGKKVYLYIKRRGWLDKTSKQVVQRDWGLVAQGTRMTVEFTASLKVLNNYQG
ncbi:transposase [Aquimarina sp. W85]|uniref:ISAon1 family transposase N-terminal region protein n=1 Tax=Aquimarina rhodophyticola TaxID=3342246 RepID=UPI0036718192